MTVEELMQHDVRTSRRSDSLAEAARQMWEGDLGAVPVVDEEGRPIGMITDRDICIASYFSGRPPGDLNVDSLLRGKPTMVRRDEPLEAAMTLMRENRVRRLPVIDREEHLVGMISLADLARSGASPAEIAMTLAAISAPSLDRPSRGSDGVPRGMTRAIPPVGAGSASMTGASDGVATGGASIPQRKGQPRSGGTKRAPAR